MKQTSDWRYAEAKRDGRKFFIRVRELPTDAELKRRYSTLVVIKWSFPPDSEGLPEGEGVLRDMEIFEDLLIGGIEDSETAIKASCITGNGQRTWEFYTWDADKFLTALNKSLRSQPPYPIEMESFPDAEWQSLRKLNASLDQAT